jgi:hypothetical protein
MMRSRNLFCIYINGLAQICRATHYIADVRILAIEILDQSGLNRIARQKNLYFPHLAA